MKYEKYTYFILLAFFKHVMNTNLGTEFECVCLVHKLTMFLFREKAICMSVKMAVTTKKTASCVFQLIQVLDTANRKKHNVCSVHWRISGTPEKYHEYISGYFELTSEAKYHDSCRVCS